MARNQSLERGLEILKLLDTAHQPLGIREIARRLEVSPTIVQRLVSTLVDGGFAQQEVESHRYRLGYRAFSLGASLLHEDSLISSAVPELRRLADEHMLNGFLCVESKGQLIYVLTVQSSGPISIRTEPGVAAHFHSTAMGKALLAELPQEEARCLLGPSPLPRMTDKTVTDLEQVIEELIQVRRQGYAISNQENLPGVVAVGAAIRNESGKAVAAISVAFTPDTAPQQKLDEIVRLVLDSAANISQRLGCPAELRLAAGQD